MLEDGSAGSPQDAGFTYQYDANGNLTRKTGKAAGAATAYTYDAENQLIRIDLPNGTAAEYAYDGLGRRIQKSVGGAVTRYVYDNEDILLELNGANALQARFTHGPGIDEPLIMSRGGQSFFYHTDGLGSITDLSDATASLVQSYVYDSFGNIVFQSGTAVNPYTYTGREFDSESGLYYYRARYYDARAGRFLQEDPINLKTIQLNLQKKRILSITSSLQGLQEMPSLNNLYSYAANNPINFLDPNGELLFTPQFAAFAAITFLIIILLRFLHFVGQTLCRIPSDPSGPDPRLAGRARPSVTVTAPSGLR